MVVCKCHKATKLYCFVHKAPVCGECICSNEHQICVVRTYSEWVIDGDYDWPPKCSICHEILQDGEKAVSRLGCLHILHTSCLLIHLQSFPLHTAPAGYTCPACFVPVWPPRSIKDYNSALPSKLKEVISQSGLSKTLLGHDVQQPAAPPAFASAPLVTLPSLNQAMSELENGSNGLLPGMIESKLDANATNGPRKENGAGTSNSGVAKGVDGLLDNANGAHSSLTMAALPNTSSPLAVQAIAMTRKNSSRSEKWGQPYTEFDGYGNDDDDDRSARKYSRRGPFHKQAIRYLLPFWSNALPTLPVTAPSRKDDRIPSIAEEVSEGRLRRRSRSSIDARKILLAFAIMSCMATMVLLYYRLSQGATTEDNENN